MKWAKCLVGICLYLQVVLVYATVTLPSSASSGIDSGSGSKVQVKKPNLALTCASLPRYILTVKEETQFNEYSQNIIDHLYNGVLPLRLNLSEVVGIEIDNEPEVAHKRVLWAKTAVTQIKQLDFNRNIQACTDLVNEVNEAEARLRQSQQQLKASRLRILMLPRAKRLSLLRFDRSWNVLAVVSEGLGKALSPQTIRSIHASLSPSSITELNALHSWMKNYREALDKWLVDLLKPNVTTLEATDRWYSILHLAGPLSNIKWNTLSSIPASDIPIVRDNWQNKVERAYGEMRLEVSRWRNKQVWNAGLSHLWTSGMDSGQLLFNLKEEVLFLPMNFADSFSRPFIRDFRTASLQHKVGKTVGLWLFQAILLVGILWFFMLISTLSLNALIKFQRAFVPMLKHPKPQKVANALFWFIKPNAYWLTLSLFSYWVITVIPEDWFLLQWLGPMGMLFAGYRAMRVIVEWTLVHTYTRSGKFLSPVISNKITTSSRHLASGLVACAVLLMGVSGTGGGELLFLLIGILLVLAWFTVAYVESMHQDAVHPFVLSVAKQIGVLSAEKAKQIHIDKMGHLTKIIYPLIYSLAFWVDILFVLHERLMFFDVYRAISVKILRIRLATQDEVEEQEEQPSDFRYRDWLLRPISERAPRIDIAFDKALVPLQVWVDNKSDDNCLLVLGDRGMGKSELAQNLSSALPEMPFKILSVDTKVLSAKELFDLLSKHIGHSIESIAELVKVDETTEKQVIVIENACNLFLSEVGCLDGYRALIDIMNAHLKNLFWVVLMHEPSWNYLKYVFEKEQRFSNVYRMPKWSALEIRKLILSRHQGSQLRIKYDEMLVSASARSESASVRSADSSVFNILWEQSGGNPLVAMQIWLESANSNGRILNVGVPSRPSSDQLNTASEDALFVYAALMFHKELTVPEIMRVSHFTESVVRQALKFGLNTGFIQKIASGYMVDTLWQNVLTLYLQRKNYLW